MLTLPHYQILSQLQETVNSVIYRGVQLENNQPVILKFLKADYPTSEELIRYQQEYEMMRYLAPLEGVIKAYSLETSQNRLVIVLEDFGGESLQAIMAKRGLTLPECLRLAIQIADHLGHLHTANVIHKDINPANIVWNPQTQQLKLIDFGIASRLPRETPSLKSPEQLEGTLIYLSPEQTGRMNRSLDYRTDLYSLGVTFYELFTGQLPFNSEDPMELVHCHLAKLPIPPQQVQSDIPAVVSNLILRLLAKNAEERYQSAWGVKADLEAIQEHLELVGNLQNLTLELGGQDASSHFHLPQKLYGRETEIETLLEAFAQVSQGPSELLLIAGYSGIGKTSLVQELYKPITAKRGYFIAGKFDQLQRNVPYSALLQAFRQFTQLLLTETTTSLRRWQQRLLTAVGHNGQVIIDVLPEVELLLGSQPAVPSLPPTESQNRFNLVFQNFIRACCQADHPLVIFLDDLQWVDSASLKLMTLMMNDIPYLFLIGAYRDNEVTPTHPLMTTVAELEQIGVRVQTLTLAPLTLPHIQQLLADTLNVKDLEKLTAFAQLLLEKTAGNPFFLGEFIKTLYTENLLHFDVSQRRWQWDLALIQAHNITDNVVELMMGKIQQLSPVSQTQLTWAAALGNRFEVTTLATVTQQEKTTVTQDLWEALVAGLIVKVGETYQFVHDRVQQAAYSLIPETKRPALHWQMGWLLLNDIGGLENSQKLEEQIFEVVDHLNVGLPHIQTANERQTLAKLNRLAGHKARQSAAYGASLKYLEMAISCLGDDAWQQDYEFTADLYKAYAEAEFLNGHFDQATGLIALLEEKVKTPLEKAEVLLQLIVQKTMEAKYHEMVEVGKRAFQWLGLEFPTDDNLSEQVRQAFSDVAGLLSDRDVSSLINVVDHQNPIYQMAIKILIALEAGIYIMGNLELYTYVSVKTVVFSLQYGNIAESAKGYANYGIIVGSGQGDFHAGYEFGKMAVAVSKQFHSLPYECKTNLLLGNWIQSWRKSIRRAKQYNLDGYHAGMASGEVQFASYNIFGYVTNNWVEGSPITEVQNRITEYLPILNSLKNDSATDGVLAVQWAIYQLTHQGNKISRYGHDISEAEYIRACQPSAMAYAPYCTFKAQALYILEQPKLALSTLEAAQSSLGGIFGFTASFEYNFYYSLVLLTLLDQVTVSQREEYLAIVMANQAQLKKWADSCKDNFLHRWALVEAELARVTGQPFEAVELYHQAIKLADSAGFVQNCALANELAGKFWLSKDQPKYAKDHLMEAHYGYQRWGAVAKVKQLEAQYPQLLTQPNGALASPKITQKGTLLAMNRTRVNHSSWLDLETVMKAAQTLSGEIVWSHLLDKMMRILIENAGAQRGVLLLPQGDQWQPAALGHLNQDTVMRLPSQTLEAQLPDMIINYVVRTGDPIVLADARRDGRYATHSYILTHQLQSVLCFPIVYQQQLRAVLYLENNLTTGAFTPDRLQVLQMLSSQIAISLENAQLLAHLDAKVQERTAELNTKIEELTQTRQELVHSEKMASLGRLVAGFAHELNTPLGVALGSASALQRDAQTIQRMMTQDEVDVDELLSAVTDLEKGVQLTLANLERAANLVTSFKRTAVDQTSGEVRTFLMSEVIEDTINTLRNHFKQTAIEILVTCPGDLKLKSLPGALEQILTNLLMNSLIHGFHEGQQAGQIHIKAQRQENSLHLEYSDNGKGIAAENLAKIFEPFFTTHRAHGGSGLGMYICYNLVTTQLQGTIRCDSVVGQGVVFQIDFPVEIYG